ncbi:MAG: hypothetical protein A2511_05025 [Deltaproteobacteria bacterium RIFOXYD12_FULL_50_9]|nr:MAG: hypothetical protein A2511_05025 [Deltaproteobacteria bacterium RIFOXYD12_FULL_50_9]
MQYTYLINCLANKIHVLGNQSAIITDQILLRIYLTKVMTSQIDNSMSITLPLSNSPNNIKLIQIISKDLINDN